MTELSPTARRHIPGDHAVALGWQRRQRWERQRERHEGGPASPGGGGSGGRAVVVCAGQRKRRGRVWFLLALHKTQSIAGGTTEKLRAKT